MAKRSLASQVLTKRNTMQKAASKSEDFQKEITDETNVNELPDEVKEKIRYLEDDMLEDDPYNLEIYGESEVEMLSRSMKDYGFQGIILAYPHEGKYRIESGHRRREAGRLAGIDKYPVLVTEAPKEEWERRMRLFLGNLHGRREKPMILARLAQGLFEAHEMEIKYKKKERLIKEGEITAINELVAIDMELDIKSVEKYRALLKLIPELQTMADSEVYSWSGLSSASTLNEEKQKSLAEMIRQQTEKEGAESVKKVRILEMISNLKLEQLSSDVKSAAGKSEQTEQKTGVRVRRKNGTKIIMKCAKSLHEVLDAESLIKENEVSVVIETLEGLKKSIDEKIDALKLET